MPSSFARNAIVLGLLCAIGPFAIDMYLPALPSIAADLGASTAATQMSLMSFFAAFGICQLVYGPVADMVGRKPPLYFGLTVFVLASIGCALAPSIEWLIFFRFVQGIGACASMVIPRAIIRDLHTGVEATRLMALIMLVFSVSPILAPLTGSALIVPFGWRAVFVGVTIAGVVGDRAHRRSSCRRRSRRSARARQIEERARRLRPAPARPALPRADLHRRPRHGELLRVPRELVLHLHRAFRTDADAVQPRLLGQRDRLHRRLAVRGAARHALRAAARDRRPPSRSTRRSRWCCSR